MKDIYYEKHPVTTERKAFLIEKGYKILDARFTPVGWKDPLAVKPKRKAPTKKDSE